MSRYQFKGLDDTIAAISTAPGQGGIGIVRVSGPGALAVADKVFKAKSRRRPSQAGAYTVHYGWVVDGLQAVDGHAAVDDPEAIDEALLTVMRAPKSYTAQDVVEISCHGGAVSVKKILSVVLAAGARLAEPGEFTKRAFLNGRIDLTQAEAVLDIIQSKTDAFLRVSAHQLKGELSHELEAIREALMVSYVELEAVINFPEDEIDARTQEKIAQGISRSAEKVKCLLKTSDHGRILREGIKIVLCGKPNVGKSSLLNILLKTPRAIVSDIEGTTRDTIEETAQIRGIPFQLVDTAGIIEPRDFIEEEAVRRSHLYIKGADLVLLVLDAGRPFNEKDERLMEGIRGQNAIIVINKIDLPPAWDEGGVLAKFPGTRSVRISVTQKRGMEELESAIVEQVWHEKAVDTHGVTISNLRHIEALSHAGQALEKCLKMLSEGFSPEFVSEEVKMAVNGLDSITGRDVDADLLDTIFSQFCIGK